MGHTPRRSQIPLQSSPALSLPVTVGRNQYTSPSTQPCNQYPALYPGILHSTAHSDLTFTTTFAEASVVEACALRGQTPNPYLESDPKRTFGV